MNHSIEQIRNTKRKTKFYRKSNPLLFLPNRSAIDLLIVDKKFSRKSLIQSLFLKLVVHNSVLNNIGLFHNKERKDNKETDYSTGFAKKILLEYVLISAISLKIIVLKVTLLSSTLSQNQKSYENSASVITYFTKSRTLSQKSQPSIFKNWEIPGKSLKKYFKNHFQFQ